MEDVRFKKNALPFCFNLLNPKKAFLSMGGEEFVPIYLHSNMVAHPDDSADGEITGYIFEGSLCWNMGNVPKSWLIVIPLQGDFSRKTIEISAHFLYSSS